MDKKDMSINTEEDFSIYFLLLMMGKASIDEFYDKHPVDSSKMIKILNPIIDIVEQNNYSPNLILSYNQSIYDKEYDISIHIASQIINNLLNEYKEIIE